MAAITSVPPLSFDLLAGLTFDFCIEKIVNSAAQSTCPTPEQEGLLVVGFGGQENSCEDWLLNAIRLWETQSCDKATDSPCRLWTRTEGSALATVLKKYRSVGSLLPVKRFLLLNNQMADISDDSLNMVIINRIDRITKNESDQFMARQYIDLMLASSSLVLVTLPKHPSTLDLHPSLASRLSAGFLLHIPDSSASANQKKKKEKDTKGSQALLGRKHDTTMPQPINVQATDMVKRVIFAVARHFSLTEKDIRNGSQRRCHVRPRGLAIYCIREMTDLSSHEIGQLFGGRDHSTVLHSLKVTEKILQKDQGTMADLRAIRSQVQQPNIC
jgi:hypothetical protein